MNFAALEEGSIDADILDTSRDLVLDHVEGGGLRSLIEWQANKFAASLLMPRSTLPDAVANQQREMGITRNVGRLYLDRQSGNFSDCRKILDDLGSIYQVSRAALRFRLRELNILDEAALTRDIRDVLGDVATYWEETIKKDQRG